jgi:lysophospholipase L1-like esterase
MKISRWVTRLFLLTALGGSLCAAAGENKGSVLVLGDSVAFGYIASVGPDYFYTHSENFVSFADELGKLLHLDVVNASCPGETTGSFLSATAPDNGCRAYRGAYPLHAGYQTTQATFALEYLAIHPNVSLVSITLGANDGLLLEETCASNPANKTPLQVEACILAGAPALLESVAENMVTILEGIRSTGYQGAIAINNYYSTDYSSAATTELTADLNGAIALPAPTFGAVVVDNFSAFEKAASYKVFGGQTCKTGLLNPDVVTPGACNIHPALTGHNLIARTIAATLAGH